MGEEAGPFDAVILGAGAAGLAAGRRLRAAGVRFVILEARPRLGGRAATDSARLGVPVDLGAQWLHNARTNPLCPLADEAGFAVPRVAADWGPQNARFLLGPAEVEDLGAATTRFFDAIHAFDDTRGDAPVSALLPASRWADLLRQLIVYDCGAQPERVSAADYGGGDGEFLNWGIREGMGTLVAHLGSGLPVRTATPAQAIDWSRRRIRVETADGTVQARRLVVTLPTNVLASGQPRFKPSLPATRMDAVHDLPLGHNEKIFVQVRGDPFGAGADMFSHSSMDCARAAHLELLPFGRPVVNAYVGDALAVELAQAGDAAATAFAADALADVFGSDVRRHLGAGFVTDWRGDPWSRGAYSYAPPGRRHARAQLATPLEERVFFAGEATCPPCYASVHGAFLSGERAAGEVLRSLGRTR